LFVIAPHEPTPERVAALLGWSRAQGLDAATLSRQDRLSDQSDHAQVIVVDSVGVLAEAYRFADVAYIGGSFSTGVHSVIEPAIMGIPVLFGPVHKNSFEAIELLRQQAAFEVNTADDIHQRLVSLMDNERLRHKMGGAARAYVESQLGATDRCMQTLALYL
jgi:3-deoxy-D-manno-octulosonic-acid transferase